MTVRGQFVLVAVPSPEVAARTNSVLRRAGIDVQVVHTARLTEAARLLHEFQPFLALYDPAVADDLPLDEFAELLAQQGTFLAVTSSEGQASDISTENLTVPAIPLQNDDDQLIALVRSLAGGEVTTVPGENQARIEQELRGDLDRAMRQEEIPVAVVHAGLHVAANPAYLRAMGLQSFDLLLGVSLLDILESPGINLKQLLRNLYHGEFPDAPLHCTVRPALNDPFHAALLFDPVRFEDEDCVQVLVRLSDPKNAVATAPTSTADGSTTETDVEPTTSDRGPETGENVANQESEPALVIESPTPEVLEFFESIVSEDDENVADRESEPVRLVKSAYDGTDAFHVSDTWPLAEPHANEPEATSGPAPTSHSAPRGKTETGETSLDDEPEATDLGEVATNEPSEPELADPTLDEPTSAATQTPEPPPVMAPKEAAARTDNVDPLTGLMSRPAFMQWLESWIEGLEVSQRGGVLYVAPEKPEQDLEGRSISEHDDYERAIARVVSRFLHEHEGASRFRDNTFTMAVTRSDGALIRELATELREAVDALAQEEPQRPMPSACSIGYVTVDPSMHDAEGAVAQAREAWRDAAAEGQEVARYRPPLSAELNDTEEAAWVSRIRHALHNDEFLTMQYDVTNLDGDAEGLVENRTYLHAEEDNVPAEAFLPVAERSGLASKIDRLVIPGLLRALAEGTNRHIINISTNSLQDFSFPSWLRREMQSSGIDGRRLVLQCSVDAARDHAKAARRLIAELEPMGCLFSLSNMNGEARNRATVGQFRPTYLRLDPELTKDLRGRPQHVDQINAVVRDARGHGAITMASDIDNSSDLAALWQCDVKLVTGDFLQKSPRVIGA